MQSYLQFKRMGHAVRKQVERDQEKATGLTTPETQDTDLIDPSSHPATLETVKTRQSQRTALGYALDGIHARERIRVRARMASFSSCHGRDPLIL